MKGLLYVAVRSYLYTVQICLSAVPRPEIKHRGKFYTSRISYKKECKLKIAHSKLQILFQKILYAYARHIFDVLSATELQVTGQPNRVPVHSHA